MKRKEYLERELSKWTTKRNMAKDSLQEARRRFDIYDEAVKDIQRELEELN